MILRLLFISCFCFSTYTLSLAQNQPDPSIYMELGGMGTGYSVNYSHPIFDNSNFTGYLRVGLSGLKTRFAVPIGLTFVSNARTHHVEGNVGITTISNGYRFWNRTASDIGVNYLVGVGYRYQRMRDKFYVSMNLFPTLRTDPTPQTFSETPPSFTLRAGLGLGFWL